MEEEKEYPSYYEIESDNYNCFKKFNELQSWIGDNREKSAQKKESARDIIESIREQKLDQAAFITWAKRDNFVVSQDLRAMFGKSCPLYKDSAEAIRYKLG